MEFFTAFILRTTGYFEYSPEYLQEEDKYEGGFVL